MRKFFLLPVLFLLFTVTSCVLGLGEVIDITAPEITLSKMECKYLKNGEEEISEQTVFTSTLYTRKNVKFYGTASDNIAVTNVYVEIKESGDSDFRFLKNAELNGNSWQIELELQNEGACWLKFVSEDKKGNYGNNSSKTASFFVDENEPVGTGWYIDRLVNGIQYNLQSKEKLYSILASDQHLLDPQNKDVAQNGEFLICASFNDAAGIFTNPDSNIPTTTISIFDEEGNRIAGPITAEEGSGNYSPKFRINDNVIKNYKNDSYALFQVRYSSKDIVTVPFPNEVTEKEVELGWFIWWPDSDKPRCSITGYDKDETINIYVGDSFNVTVFDDDGLSGNVELYKGETPIGSKSINNADREVSFEIKAPENPEKFTLKITAHDIYGNKLNIEKNVNVIDKFNPTLILTSPENNQIPEVSGQDANIEFSGVTLDTSGCNYLEFVWVPDSVKADYAGKKALATELLDSLNRPDPAKKDQTFHDEFAPGATGNSKCTVFTTEFDSKFKDVKLWSAKLTPKASEDKFKQHEFKFTVSLLNDFAADKNKEKYFFTRVTRDETACSDSEFKLAADNIAPEIVPVNPSGNMAIIDEDQDFVIKFKAKKDNGLLMNTAKYKIEYLPYDKDDKKENYEVLVGHYDSTKGVYIGNTVSKETLKKYTENNKNLKVILYAEDLLGNSTSATYQAIISALPKINTVTSSAPAKCKLGDEILINVSFSKALSLSDTSNVNLKLKNIVNSGKSITKDTIVEAPMTGGNNSTTLVFSYTVEAGDASDGLEVYNEPGKGPIEGIELTTAHVEVLEDSNNLQSKRSTNPIKIDGTVPKATGVTITTDGEDGNKNGGITYLRAGKTITAKVTTDKAVTVQGSPKFELNNIILDWQSVSSNGKEITFAIKITNETEGALSYTADCISGIDTIKDDFGNSLVSSITAADANVVIDRTKPGKPSITVLNTNKGSEGKFNGSAEFTVTPGTDANIAKTEYSTDGGRTWNLYSSTVTVYSTSSLVARSTDWAGNVSEYSSPIDVQINSTFPDFTVECTTPDGRYKLGEILEFKVYFANEVEIPDNSEAYISLSAETGTITSEAKATITKASKGDNVTEATFEYTVREGDDFTLKVAKDGVHLNGIKDKYGVAWTSEKTLADDYTRTDLVCDTVLPYVVSMTPQGTKTTQNGLNAYNNAKKIKLTFNEPVSVVSGKIYLRQTEGWAIPPMFTAEEFRKVLNAAKSATIDTSRTNGLTASQVLYMDGLEDAESLYGSTTGPANDRYHGTAQYVGPYKKMTNGVDDSGNPDLSVKYVLDFGVDIRDSSKSTKTKFGITYEPHSSSDLLTYHHLSQAGLVKVVEPENTITTDSIRYVLEQANYHQRYMAVNSNNVEVNDNEVTLNFPEGLLGDDELPLGREWKLVIEKDTFMDETGNLFAHSSTEDTILIKEGDYQTGNNSFMSAGAAKPVIRVDRYSYGLGIKQPKSITDGVIEYEQIDVKSVTSRDCINGNGTHVPTAKVGVRIDCESKGAKIRYSRSGITKNKDNATNSRTDGGATNNYSTTDKTLPADPTGEGADNIIFLAGSENYLQSCKQYFKAQALYSETVKSDIAQEGVFQTVLNINQPKHNGGGNTIYNAGKGRQDVNIHGTTGLSGEPTISPFPLRDQNVCSAYMRRTYQKGDQYYWLSYEVLVDSCYSMYVFGMYAYGGDGTQFGVAGFKYGWGDWSKSYGLMKPGEFNTCPNMESWTGKSTFDDNYIVPDKNQ